MNRLFDYLFGTHRRFVWTMSITAVVFAVLRPDLLQAAINGVATAVLTAVEPLIQPALTIFILIFGLKLLWNSVFGKKSSK
jgi:hypothetical protein